MKLQTKRNKQHLKISASTFSAGYPEGAACGTVFASLSVLIDCSLLLLGTSYFTFQLDAFYKSDHTGVVPNPVALNTTLYFKASVVTQSVTPNLDLFIEVCYASNSSSSGLNPGSSVRLIKNGWVFLLPIVTQHDFTKKNKINNRCGILGRIEF